MKSMRALAFVVVCACSPADPPTTIAPLPEPTASVAPGTENARTDYEAADTLVTAGKFEEARTAFDVLSKKFPYSRFARDAELRIAQIDEKLGRPEALTELATWAKNHASDPRAQAIAAKAKTIGDTTCRSDADCTTTTKYDCCTCCEGPAKATSKQWLTWRAEQCAATRCEACSHGVCGPPGPPASARCNTGRCELVP